MEECRTVLLIKQNFCHTHPFDPISETEKEADSARKRPAASVKKWAQLFGKGAPEIVGGLESQLRWDAMLRVFTEFAKLHKFDYSLAMGTLLGVKRNPEGFSSYTPWDGDLDSMIAQDGFDTKYM